LGIKPNKKLFFYPLFSSQHWGHDRQDTGSL
jgi:hypothetical protein